MNKTTCNNNAESGNALFLILIAVVLFAALSYAITQSNRGGGAPNRETSLISSTAITQYSSAIRTGITRMTLRNVDVASLDFTAPTDATAYAAAITANNTPNMVFHADGGGVSFTPVDQNIVNTVSTTMSSTQNGNWYFKSTPVTGVATAAADLVAFLDDLKKPLCESINLQINGNKTIPVLTGTPAAIVAGSVPVTGTGIDNKSFLCVGTSTANHYVYYHVMVEQ
ncbi:MAG: hypothetical protein JWM96_1233 [Alphaproteobacteria bacterium]|nr:hypothetical protein [Alphaproteobacteria bacterium]